MSGGSLGKRWGESGLRKHLDGPWRAGAHGGGSGRGSCEAAFASEASTHTRDGVRSGRGPEAPGTQRPARQPTAWASGEAPAQASHRVVARGVASGSRCWGGPAGRHSSLSPRTPTCLARPSGAARGPEPPAGPGPVVRVPLLVLGRWAPSSVTGPMGEAHGAGQPAAEFWGAPRPVARPLGDGARGSALAVNRRRAEWRPLSHGDGGHGNPVARRQRSGSPGQRQSVSRVLSGGSAPSGRPARVVRGLGSHGGQVHAVGRLAALVPGAELGGGCARPGPVHLQDAEE